ncbi:phytanoyl-CoA dioxygenase family protein [Nocardia sp. NPDC101769]|uniref:phytanoyl-CoA dioxygenase family protein n=1 Tax=Nocardia sp. NPDC101769 TaxID=3364333 RepID=UPI0038285C18
MTSNLTDDPVFALTPTERALLPDDDDIDFYRRHGWYLSRPLLTDAEVDTLLEASERFYAGHRDRRLPMRPPRLAYWEPEKGPVQRHNDYIHYESAAIAEILRKPLIGAVAARLAQADTIRIFQSTLIYKPAVPGERSNLVPWHFDKHYWATSTSTRMLTAFIPFHDCTAEHGTITMIDGSHHWHEIGERDSTTKHFADRDAGELDRMLAENAAHNDAVVSAVPISIPKGHMSFHHCRTYHGSGANRSGVPRRAISLHLQDGDNRYRDFTLGDGTRVHYNHDHLVRRDGGRPDYSDSEFCPTIWRETSLTTR